MLFRGRIEYVGLQGGSLGWMEISASLARGRADFRERGRLLPTRLSSFCPDTAGYPLPAPNILVLAIFRLSFLLLPHLLLTCILNVSSPTTL